jgi:hypothetical protein
MSNAARAYARKAAPKATTSTEAPVNPASDSTPNTSSIWTKIKTAAKAVARTIARPFQAVARKAAPTAKTVAKTVAKPFVFVARKATPTVKAVGRFLRKHWGKILGAALVAAMFFIAPLGVAIGATFITSGIILMTDENWFSRLIGEIFAEIGIRVVIESVVGALGRR